MWNHHRAYFCCGIKACRRLSLIHETFLWFFQLFLFFCYFSNFPLFFTIFSYNFFFSIPSYAHILRFSHFFNFSTRFFCNHCLRNFQICHFFSSFYWNYSTSSQIHVLPKTLSPQIDNIVGLPHPIPQ